MSISRLDLADWRRATAEFYAKVREISSDDPERARRYFRERRDRLFKRHPSSPLSSDQRRRFNGLTYYPYDPDWRLTGTVNGTDAQTREIELPEGTLQLTRVGRVDVPLSAQPAHLNLFWIDGYGGGLFLPFKDATNGDTTYGGGRYLYDTIKGADLGVDAESIVLDFNFAYHPSCAYSAEWICPLAPMENVLPVAVEAGERLEDLD